jgi:putative transposase
MGIEAVYPKPKLSQPGEGHRIYPYLLRGTTVERVNQVWSTDITYIRMAQGFLYLVAVMDWFSRFVLSWSLSLTMEVDFCIEALQRALRRGRPDIFNSDQGSQFTSDPVHRRTGSAPDRDQHGRAGTLHGQHFRRAPVAFAQIRGGGVL